jgi:hypothetical protein
MLHTFMLLVLYRYILYTQTSKRKKKIEKVNALKVMNSSV